MGLKIGYYFEFKGTKRELVCKMEKLQRRFKDMPVERIREIHRIEKATFERTSDFWENMLGFGMLLNHYKRPGLGDDSLWEKRRNRIQKSGNGLCFVVDIGPGCESFTVFFGRLGNGKVWRGMGCTKTQYAEHFVDAHTLVIRLLDICRDEGILEKVNDDGGYWETRDLKVLAENINASTEFMKLASKALTQIGEKKLFIVHNSIDECANYVNVKDKEPRIT